MAGVNADRSDLKKAAMRAVVVGTEPAAGKSTQPEPDPWTPDEAIKPPLDPELLSALTVTAPLRRSCIAAITLNTVGIGFDLKPIEGREDEGSADDGTDLKAELDALARRDDRLGRPTFTRLLSAWQWDRQEVGSGYLEVSRNTLTGEIDGLYHAPGKRVRRKADRSGYIMGPRGGAPSEMTHFYEFGAKVIYDADGRPTGKLTDGRTGGRWDRNELIALRMFTSQSRDYGLPPDAQLAIDYRGDKLAAQANVGYFDHSGVPPTVFFVQGREATDSNSGEIEFEVDPNTISQITNMMRAGGGSSRVAIVPIPAGTTVDRQDLAVLSDRDVGFVNYRSDNRRRTLGAWRISPIFVADIDDAGRYTADVERAITKEQVFDPEQREIADVLNATIIREKAPHLQLLFEQIKIKGDDAKRQSANDLAMQGRITNGEFREAHGYPPLPERAPGEQVPAVPDGKVEAGWNLALVDPANVAATGVDPAALAKAMRHDPTAAEIEDEFDRAMDDAVAAVSQMADGAELRPVVIEKVDGGGIRVTPYVNGNGVGA